MAATGAIESDGTVTVTWNMQAEKLMAPGGGHYLPCEVCGVVQEVTLNTVAMTCRDCGDVHGRQYELDGREVEDVVGFMRQLGAGWDRPKALALKVGESADMDLGSDDNPSVVLRRVS